LDLRLALEEVLTNAVLHGGARGPEDRISVRLSCDEASIEVEVRDPGAPFDPLGHPSPALDRPLEEREPGGLGILLFRRIARDPQYRRESKENVLTFRIPRARKPASLPSTES
jgi:anti-sigma regulatory factor (Ser/Thr protein kinase)